MIDREGLEQRLALAREGFSPPAAAKARVRAGLSPMSPVQPPLARLNDRAKAVGVAKPMVGLIAAVTFAAVTFAAVTFVAGFWLGRSETSEPRGDVSTASPQPLSMQERSALATEHPSAPSAPNAPVATERTMNAARVTPSPIAEPSSRALHAPPPAARATGARVSPRALKDELALLKRAERAIRAKEAALALSFLDELDRRHPRSALREERTAARIIAECMLSLPAAGSRAAHFLEAHRDSVYVDRVRRACEPID
jgi:hypothetical protein